MFGIDGVELVLIIVIAVLMFGPEKLPEYSRKAARIFVYLRGIANNTQNSLREQLGPEYSDLELRDLNPKTFVKKHLSQEIAALEEAKREIEQMKTQLDMATGQVSSEVNEATALAKQSADATDSEAASGDTPGDAAETVSVGAALETSPYDPEAT